MSTKNILTLDAGGSNLATINLGEPTKNGYYDEGDLAPTSGNLYIYVDGVEYGSLFFYRDPSGQVTVTLGQFDFDAQDWVEKSCLSAYDPEGEEAEAVADTYAECAHRIEDLLEFYIYQDSDGDWWAYRAIENSWQPFGQGTPKSPDYGDYDEAFGRHPDRQYQGFESWRGID